MQTEDAAVQRSAERSSERPRRSLQWLCAGLAALGWTLAGVYFLVALLVLCLRYWILPDLASHSSEIERIVSATIGQKVSIGRVDARWQGLHPEVDLSDVRIHDKEGRVALSLPVVEAVIGWRSIAFASLRLHSLAIEQPVLDIRRGRDRRISVAGLELHDDGSGAQLSAWVLAQSEIVIRDAKIQWDDELRAAPTLALSGVTLVLRNSGQLHSFGLKAQTSRELASALDVRGEMRGASFANLSDWRGLAFAELDYVDLAAWHSWLDYPIEVNSGQGALRLWVSFDGPRVTEATADVALAKVRTRLAKDLPQLDLEYLQGRIGGGDDGRTVKVQGRRIALKSTGGVALPPADFRLNWQRGSGDAPPQGELEVNTLELDPLVKLAEFLPFPGETRKQLAEFNPRGSLNDLKLAWSGDPDRMQRYSVKGRFTGLGVAAPGSRLAVAGLTGAIDASETSGSVQLRSDKVGLDLPGVLADKPADLDRLAGKLSWRQAAGRYEAIFSDVLLENRDFSASVQGSFSTPGAKAPGPGSIDLTANIARASVNAVYRYIPFLPEPLAAYLKSALVAGQASDARLRLKGDLKDFPWPDGKSGLFRVSSRFTNGELLYVQGWPRGSNLNGEFNMEGTQIQINASRGSVLGARLASVQALIPDFLHGDTRLRLDAQADGATGEFLRFIRASPLASSLGTALKQLSASGGGRLQMRLDVPLGEPEKTRVAGNFQLLGNDVVVDASFPPLKQVNGRVEFTENGFGARNVAAQILGGPATFSIATQGEEAFSVTAQGTADLAAVRGQFDLAWLERARGSAGWRGSLALAGGNTDFTLESPLTGVAVDLPAPLGKSATASVPFRLERTTRANEDWLKRAGVQQLPPGGDAVMFSYGRIANGIVLRRGEGERKIVERGALGLNESAPPLGKNGIAVAGRFAALDFDVWRAVLGADDGPGAMVSDLKLSIGALDLAGKRLNDVKLAASPAAEGWRADLSARELAGTVTWLPKGRGRIVGRLKYLTVPEAAPGAAPQESAGSELPALDIVADEFKLRDTRLGRLELVAVNDTRDWRIERLALRTGDSELTADGRWQSWAVRPSVNLNVNLEVSDVGAFLTRLGFPGTVRSGTAKLAGKLGWVGSPQSIDYPTLVGSVTLSAEKGQFLKADQGIAKLLGILSLQSWITLDFRDTFGEGFAFGTLKATAQIAKGKLTTEDFVMAGNSALVTMSGTVDLADETQNLKVLVVPSVGDSASSGIGLILANPIVGLAAFLAQRILKDPLGKAFANQYVVTGTWNDPIVEKLITQPATVGNP